MQLSGFPCAFWQLPIPEGPVPTMYDSRPQDAEQEKLKKGKCQCWTWFRNSRGDVEGMKGIMWSQVGGGREGGQIEHSNQLYPNHCSNSATERGAVRSCGLEPQ